MKKQQITKPVSLLSPNLMGGIHGGGGYEFQLDVAMAYLPYWLSLDCFDSISTEISGDIEVKLFHPYYGWLYEHFEIKNYVLSSKQFIDEIEQFYQLETLNTEAHVRFILVCKGLADKYESLENTLKRVRDSVSFYSSNATIWRNTLGEFSRKLSNVDIPSKYHDLIMKKLEIENSSHGSFSYAKPGFMDSWDKCLSCLPINSSNQLIYDEMRSLLSVKRGKKTARSEFDQIILKYYSKDDFLLLNEAVISTLNSNSNLSLHDTCGIVLDWSKHFVAPHKANSEDEIVKPLKITKSWLDSQQRKQVLLKGHRKFSAVFAIGAIFSAKAGYRLSMPMSNGESWVTNPVTKSIANLEVRELNAINSANSVIAISVIFDITQQIIDQYPQANSISIFYPKALGCSEEATELANVIKAKINSWMQKYPKIETIDLCFRGPSFLLLLLGYRWNFITNLNVCEYIDSQYIPCVKLNKNDIW